MTDRHYTVTWDDAGLVVRHKPRAVAEFAQVSTEAHRGGAIVVIVAVDSSGGLHTRNALLAAGCTEGAAA